MSRTIAERSPTVMLSQEDSPGHPYQPRSYPSWPPLSPSCPSGSGARRQLCLWAQDGPPGHARSRAPYGRWAWRRRGASPTLIASCLGRPGPPGTGAGGCGVYASRAGCRRGRQSGSGPTTRWHVVPDARSRLLDWVIMRWAVEVTCAAVRAPRGVETPRQWSDKAIARTTPVLWALWALVTVLALPLSQDGQIPVPVTAWYHPDAPTSSACLALVRRHLWPARSVVHSTAEAEFVQLPREAFDLLLTGLPLAA
jgi:hypothetical protein